MACSDPECSDDAAIREAIERIAYEAHHLREDMAALKALGQARDRMNCSFMLVASSGLQSDLLARLARVLERDQRVGIVLVSASPRSNPGRPPSDQFPVRHCGPFAAYPQ